MENNTGSSKRDQRNNTLFYSTMGVIGIVLLLIIGVAIGVTIGSDNTTPTPVPTVTSEDVDAAFAPILQNSDWTPVEIDFDGIGMVLVPAGHFQMGSTQAEIERALELCIDAEISGSCTETLFMDEAPTSEQTFSRPFWIDRTEVTRSQYQVCVDAGACSDALLSENFIDDDHPITNLTYSQAQTYCEWRGGRLPTEAEWEYAARGPDRLIFPWGNSFDAAQVNHCDIHCIESWADDPISPLYGYEDTDDGYASVAPVARFPGGVSWVGAYDMAGNVAEWTSSHDMDYPYDATDGREDLTQINSDRIIRGGSYNTLYGTASTLRTAYRASVFPTLGDIFSDLGVRCVRPAEDS